MPENTPPQEVALSLVRVINGELPRRRAEDYLDANVKIHIDSANHRGIELWYKWLDVVFGILLILEKLGIVWRLKRKKGGSRT
jgi:hypothetical protein